MRGEIITIGTELLLGQTVDLHSQYISKQVASIGIEIFYHTSLGDNCDKLEKVIKNAAARSDIIFLCGGLGPTEDDITKEALAKHLSVDLVPSNNSKNTHKSGLVLEGATVFSNPVGTAPGFASTKDNIIYLCLPGPPTELRAIFTGSVASFLLSKLSQTDTIQSHFLSFFGISEPALEERLLDLIKSPNPTLAPYINDDTTVTLRITAKASSEQQASKLIEAMRLDILERAGEYCYSESEQSLEEIVIELLRENEQSVALSESCTGGLVSYLLSTVPGSSGELKGGFVCYTNEIKERLVGVPRDVLERYGAVSSQTAELLADLTRKKFSSSYAISITGVAGPASTERRPVGEVYIGFAEKDRVLSYRFLFQGLRKKIQLKAAKQALFMLQNRLKKGVYV